MPYSGHFGLGQVRKGEILLFSLFRGDTWMSMMTAIIMPPISKYEMLSSHWTLFSTLYYTRRRNMVLNSDVLDPLLNCATYEARVSSQRLAFFIYTLMKSPASSSLSTVIRTEERKAHMWKCSCWTSAREAQDWERPPSRADSAGRWWMEWGILSSTNSRNAEV